MFCVGISLDVGGVIATSLRIVHPSSHQLSPGTPLWQFVCHYNAISIFLNATMPLNDGGLFVTNVKWSVFYDGLLQYMEKALPYKVTPGVSLKVASLWIQAAMAGSGNIKSYGKQLRMDGCADGRTES